MFTYSEASIFSLKRVGIPKNPLETAVLSRKEGET